MTNNAAVMESESIFNRKKKVPTVGKKFISKGIKGYHLVFPPTNVFFYVPLQYTVACLEALHMIKILIISQNRLNVTKYSNA